MKKLFISAAVILATLSMSAKVFTPGEVHRVNIGQSIDQPVLSADGTFVVTSNVARSIDRIDLATGKVTPIVEGEGLYNVTVSPDGNTVAYTRPSYNDKHLRFISLETVDMTTGQKQVVVKPSRNLSAGIALTDSKVTAVNNGRKASKAISGKTAAERPVVAIDHGHLTVDGNAIDPQGRGSYLWPSLSPDGTKIVYWMVYRGCFVCDLDGSNPRAIGGLRAAVWAGNDAVIGMVEEEGTRQVIESSALVAVDLNTGEKQVITPETVRAMYPSANADATRVAFTDPDGNLYYMDLNK